MQVHYPHSAGLDVHTACVVANIVTGQDAAGNEVYAGKRFPTMTRDLLLSNCGYAPLVSGTNWKPSAIASLRRRRSRY